MLDFEITNNNTNRENMTAFTLFHIIDSDSKGYITQKDIKNVPKLIPTDLLKLIHFNRSDKINLQEFETIYENLNNNELHHSNEEEDQEEEEEEAEEEDFGKIKVHRFSYI
jgi:Ca2+-binding EF-hand superfamily protein